MSFYFNLNQGYSPFASLEQYQHLSYPHLQQIPSTAAVPLFWAPTPSLPALQPLSVSPQPVAVIPQAPQSISRGGRGKKRMEKTVEKELMSAKKNGESNIINQFYSFFSHAEKSEKVVRRCLGQLGKTASETQHIIPIFYNAIRIINIKRGRKYVNASLLAKFFTPQLLGQYLEELKTKIQELTCMSVGQFCEVFRRCTHYFLRQVSVSAILTSKRISIISKDAHLKKRRKIRSNIVRA